MAEGRRYAGTRPPPRDRQVMPRRDDRIKDPAFARAWLKSTIGTMRLLFQHSSVRRGVGAAYA